MRIAIYHNLPSGGGKRALFEITRRLAQSHKVDVYTLSCAEHDFCDLRPFSHEHHVFPFNPLPLAKRPFGRLNQGFRTVDLFRLRSLQRKIAEQIDNVGYNVVFVHNCRYGQSPSLLFFLRTPSVYYCGEPPRQFYEPPVERPYTQFSPVQRLGNRLDPLLSFYQRTLTNFDRSNVCSATQVLVNSQYSRETLYHTYGIFAQVGRLGTDVELFRPVDLEKINHVVSVGSLVPRKGFDFLIHSLSLIEAGIRPKLTIVSNSVLQEEQAYLEKLAHDLKVELEIRHQVTNRELVEIYNSALITLCAQIMEPFGFVPLESMACGTPVVAVHEAGLRETVIHGHTGFLTERDHRKFAEAVVRLLANKQLRQAFGEYGKTYVETDWLWQRSVDILEKRMADVTMTSTV